MIDRHIFARDSRNFLQGRRQIAFFLAAAGLFFGGFFAPESEASEKTKNSKSISKKIPKNRPDGKNLKGVKVKKVTATVVDFTELSRRPAIVTTEENTVGEAVPNQSINEETGQNLTETPIPNIELKPEKNTRQKSIDEKIDSLMPPSPAPTLSFLGHPDGAKIGTGTFTIPPDTTGAVGLDKVVVHLNNNYVVQDKVTGANLGSVSIDTFWASTGASGFFDPRVVFDPYNQRWIVTAVSNAQTANSSVVVGVSQTSDPQGTWLLYRFTVGCAAGAGGCNAAGEWADFPMLGFNKNWLAIGWNQFTITTGAFIAGKMLVIDYPTARAGTATSTIFTNASAATGFCMNPAATFSTVEETLFVPTHQQSGGALYRLHSITGTPAVPVFTLDATARVRPGGGWTQPGGDNLPQQCIPGVGAPTQTCPATPRGLEAGDSFIRSNSIFRGGRIWYAQSIALPAGGLATTSRFAAQWTVLNRDGTFNQGGRIEDPLAQIFNGGKHYSYPSIAVNINEDVMVGFSEFESDDYADAGYAFRMGTDAAGTMNDPIIYKEGEDYYQKTFSGTRNRWGDYSHTVVDPSDGASLWTLQEYAQLRVGTTGQGSNDSRWSTWWAKLTLIPTAADGSITGRVLRSGTGIGRVKMALVNTRTGDQIETFTGSDGTYTFDGLETGDTYILTASRVGYTFNPGSKVFTLLDDLSDVDFTTSILKN